MTSVVSPIPFSGTLTLLATELETCRAGGLYLALHCYGSRYFGGSVPHTGRGNRGTSRQPD
ncbi:MAG: hypothetical protein BECKG1743D_GA0114223_111001, partial [Candidatus Kentron sp. G]